MLTTENAGALVQGGGENKNTKTVEVLIDTMIKSVGRDCKVGEVVDVSEVDYRFLKPYNFVKDFDPDAEAEPEAEAEEATDEVDTVEELVEAVEEFVESTGKVEGKRKK